MDKPTITVYAGRYEDRAKAGNLTPAEVSKLYQEMLQHKDTAEDLQKDVDTMLYLLRLIARSGSQWKVKAQQVIDTVEFGTDNPVVIEAARRALEFKARKASKQP